MSDDLVNQIRKLVAYHTGMREEKFELSTDIIDSSGIYGDDVWELIEEFAKKFNVDVDNFRSHWFHHTGSEADGCNPFVLLTQPFWDKKKWYVPIRLADLVKSAQDGVWCITYPAKEKKHLP